MSKRIGPLPVKMSGERLLLSAVEGWGKTSCAAFAPNSAIIMTKGEDGFLTLRQGGLVPDRDAVQVDSWLELLDVIRNITPGQYSLLGIDALSGAERLCHEYICETEFNGDWGEHGFLSYMKGYERTIFEWPKILAALDKIRQGGTNILFLSHTRVVDFKDPIQPISYQKVAPDCHYKVCAITTKWADAVFYGCFETVLTNTKVNKQTQRMQGIAGTTSGQRVIHTESCDAYTAKNRHGCPPEIEVPNDHTKVYSVVASALGWDKKSANVDEIPAV